MRKQCQKNYLPGVASTKVTKSHLLRCNPYQIHRNEYSPDGDCDWQIFWNKKNVSYINTKIKLKYNGTVNKTSNKLNIFYDIRGIWMGIVNDLKIK